MKLYLKANTNYENQIIFIFTTVFEYVKFDFTFHFLPITV